jgi:hypothetical protein
MTEAVKRRYDNSAMVRYGFDNNQNMASADSVDARVVSGRVFILPQPSYSLATNVSQILKNTFPDDLTALGLNTVEQKILGQQIADLEFLSAPLAGLTASLPSLQGTRQQQHQLQLVKEQDSYSLTAASALCESLGAVSASAQ